MDYLSLDVEGSELPVLRTLPFSRMRVRVLTVEVAHGGGDASEREMVAFMAEKGFRMHRRMESNIVFVSNEL